MASIIITHIARFWQGSGDRIVISRDASRSSLPAPVRATESTVAVIMRC